MEDSVGKRPSVVLSDSKATSDYVTRLFYNEVCPSYYAVFYKGLERLSPGFTSNIHKEAAEDLWNPNCLALMVVLGPDTDGSLNNNWGLDQVATALKTGKRVFIYVQGTTDQLDRLLQELRVPPEVHTGSFSSETEFSAILDHTLGILGGHA